MKRDYNKLLESGNNAQIEKLMANEHKKGFENAHLLYLLKRIIDECTELKDEIVNIKSMKEKENIDYKTVRLEFADIANFCHMGILTCDEEIKKSV